MELLIKAQSNNTATPWQRGRIVCVKPDGHAWGAKESPPNFYIVKVPGVSVESAAQYLEEWHHRPVFELLSSDNVTDVHTYKMIVDVAPVRGRLTLSKVEDYFTKWGCTITGNTPNSVTFDADIFKIATSSGFWNRNVSGMRFTDSYNGTAHEIAVTGASGKAIKKQCLTHEVTYIAPNKYSINRNQALLKMRNDIYAQFEQIIIDRRRWYLSSTAMDLLDSAGEMTVTAQQLLSHLLDGFID